MNNELRYKTFQLQDSFTKYGTKHTLTFGATHAAVRIGERVLELLPAEQLHVQLAGGFLHRRQRLPRAIRTGRRRQSRCGAFKVRYSNVPGLEKPVQPLQVWYSGAYAQDEWRPRRDVTVTAGIRMDVSMFKNTAYPERQGRCADVPR